VIRRSPHGKQPLDDDPEDSGHALNRIVLERALALDDFFDIALQLCLRSKRYMATA
jgi:hypothetical protein